MTVFKLRLGVTVSPCCGLVQKKCSSLRMRIDYWQLSKISIRDRSSLPHVQDLLDQVSQCTIFSTLDLAVISSKL
jgi:hypothetical protein